MVCIPCLIPLFLVVLHQAFTWCATHRPDCAPPSRPRLTGPARRLLSFLRGSKKPADAQPAEGGPKSATTSSGGAAVKERTAGTDDSGIPGKEKAS